MAQWAMGRAGDIDDNEQADARFWPVFELATGRVVGAELVGSSLAGARSFASGAAAAERWWVSVRPDPDQLVAAVRDCEVEPGRLVVQVTEAELTRAAASCTTDALGSRGVRFAIVDFGLGSAALRTLRTVSVAFAHVSLSGLDGRDPADVRLLRSAVARATSLDIDVVGDHVETDEQLILAGEVGIPLVQGYRWGSAGSLSKLVATWTRHTVSE